MSVREESFILIDEAVPSLRENKTNLELDSVIGTFLNSELNIVASKKIEAAYPNNMFGKKLTEIGTHSIFHEPQTGVADISLSTNVSADSFIIGRDFTSDLGLIAGIKNTNCGLEVCGDLLIDKSNAEILTLDNQGVVFNKSFYEIGSLASCNTSVLMDTSLVNIDGGNEFLVMDSSLGGMFYGPKLTGEASFLGTPESTFLDVGTDFNYELGSINQVGVGNIQAENNFNLVDADLGIGFASYNSLGIADSVNFVDSCVGSSWIGDINQIRKTDYLFGESQDELNTVHFEQPVFENEKFEEVKNIYRQFQDSMDSGNISHFMQYAEVGNKRINIYCMNLSIYVDGDFIGSHHIGNKYTLKVESNE